MNLPSENQKTGLEILYRLLCLPYFALICFYWLIYLFTPYLSYAVWNAHLIYMDHSESASSALGKILTICLFTSCILIILKILIISFSWAILKPLSLRLSYEQKKYNISRSLIEYSVLFVFLISPAIIANFYHNFFGIFSVNSSSIDDNLSKNHKNKLKDNNKFFKSMSNTTVDKIRLVSMKGLELMSLAETLNSQPPVKNAEEINIQFSLLQKDALKAEKEADTAFNELRQFVKEADDVKYWAHLQAVDRYKYICENFIKLWMLSLKARYLTNEEGIEARKKMGVECMAISKYTVKLNSEIHNKMNIACESISNLNTNKDSTDDENMDAARKAIREICFEVVKSGFYISKEHDIID